jgi:hypothetical protein
MIDVCRANALDQENTRRAKRLPGVIFRRASSNVSLLKILKGVLFAKACGVTFRGTSNIPILRGTLTIFYHLNTEDSAHPKTPLCCAGRAT